MKKAQGLSLNVIIVAAIVLIVLIVLWAIFTGKMGDFVNDLTKAEQDCTQLCSATGKTGGPLIAGNTCTTGDAIRVFEINGAEQVCCCT